MPSFRILEGHWLDAAKSLPDRSVHCAITSPPYYQLRSYKTEPQIWDGDPLCEHRWGGLIPGSNRGGSGTPTDKNNRGEDYARALPRGRECSACSAWRGELGQEPTPADFVRHLVQIFGEVKRVLRDDGLLWVNLGDSYFGDSPIRDSSAGAFSQSWNPADSAGNGGSRRSAARQGDIKPQDLIGVPWTFALAMRADGWYLRRDIIWAKRNSMPESVQGVRWEKHRIKLTGHQRKVGYSNSTEGRPQSDSAEWSECPGCKKCDVNGGLILRHGAGRCTSSFEYIFMFSKTMDYWYDSIAVQEPCESGPSDIKKMVEKKDRIGGRAKSLEDKLNAANSTTHIGNKRGVGDPAGRNRRSVWTLVGSASNDDHYAAFPIDVPAIPIMASTSEYGHCAECGAGYARIVQKITADGRGSGNKERVIAANGERDRLNTHMGSGIPWQPEDTRTLGWKRTCGCETNEIVPATVLDPFLGRGTSGIAAIRLGRNFVGCELNPKYAAMARKNISNEAPLFTKEET